MENTVSHQMTLQGFFQSGEADGSLATSLLPACGACGLWKSCHSPKMPVFGKGRKEIMIIGQSPGDVEDKAGRPFVGPSGQKIGETFRRFGIDLTEDCWITNALRCHPAKNKTPPKSIDHCRPYVIQAITELKPKLIVLLGGEAVQSVIGWLYPHDSNGYDVTRWRGWQIPSQATNAWVCSVWHPTFLLHNDYGEGPSRDSETKELIWENDLRAALSHQGRPWPDGPPRLAKGSAD